ncbi:MAG TPA: phenylalanine--tRNA ligase subunit beta [Chthonomonadaceae bacterium]|nr:phenylalanine--tRNA ligase subunit beta [Chthonomonadaceae bacterium]
MRVPYEWLKEYVAVEAPAEEVATRLMMGGLEVEGIEESPIGPVLDVYVTPNRGDCASMLGAAREVAALFDLPLNTPTPPEAKSGGEAEKQTSVTIEAPDLCPRYAARLVRGVKIGPSPAWLQERLEAAGQRPINNVVDVTNYVMLELGQPLHAFDFDKLAGGRIVVRQAREGEALTTLDGQERPLLPTMLVIADAEKPVAVAGVMGGADSEVSEGTSTLLLESAHFDPLSVRRTSRALGLRTEASYRFERVVDPNGVRRAVDCACELLAKIGQPEAVPGVVDVYPRPIAPRVVLLRVNRAAELLGMEITPEIAEDCLRRLEFGVTRSTPVRVRLEAGPHGSATTPAVQLSARTESEEVTLEVRVPTFRPDITLEEDLVEEVGRIHGYENIPETLPAGVTTQGGDSAEARFIREVKRLLVEAGLQEVVTHSLSAPAFFDPPADAFRRVAIRNALSAEVSGLRRSLIAPLLDVAQHNATRGQQAFALFEVGRVWENAGEDGVALPVETVSVAGLLVGPLTPAGWQHDGRPIPADFYTARGVLERLFAGLGITEAAFTPLNAGATRDLPAFHPGRTALIGLGGETEGVVGEVHPQVAARTGLREPITMFEIGLEALRQAAPAEGPRYHPLSRFPAVTRDLAPRVALELPYAQMEAAVRAAEAPDLEEFKLTDVFQGPPLPEGLKSLTLSFTFRAPDRTLSEAEVSAALGRIREQLESRCSATFPA